MSLTNLISETQSALGLISDGIAGPLTWDAIHRRIVSAGRSAQKAAPYAPDERSARMIATLHPEVARVALEFLKVCHERALDVRIIAGLRSFAEQDALYEKGRIKPGKIVTNARGGQSWHNYGLAFDVGVFEGAEYLSESPIYEAAGRLGESLGLEWGGAWKFRDEPHFQLRPKWASGLRSPECLTAFAMRLAKNQDLFA